MHTKRKTASNTNKHHSNPYIYVCIQNATMTSPSHEAKAENSESIPTSTCTHQ